MIPKFPNSPPWWTNIIVIFAFVCTAVFGYNEVFPDPQVIELHEEFKVHEVSPAHGIEKIQTVQSSMQIVQGIIVDDLREVESEINEFKVEQQTTNELLREMNRRIR